MFPANTYVIRNASADAQQALPFPPDPRAPGAPDRSESLRRSYARRGRLRRRLRLLTLAEPRAQHSSGWPPVTQLRPLGSSSSGNSGRYAA